jgi:membrane-associated protein
MHELLNIPWHDWLSNLFHPDFYINNGGLWLLLFIVFAETGLMVGFFLPGDSLLFVSGMFSTKLIASFTDKGMGSTFLDLVALWVMISICGILGNLVGYWFGHKSGPYLYHRKDNFLFKKKYLFRAKEFFEKHGGEAIVFARFLPIIRTFTPIIAGIVAMDRKKFILYNIVGCLAWVFTMVFAGHYLQEFFWAKYHFDLKDHLEVIVIGIVVVTTAPVLFKLFFGKRNAAPAEDPYKKP